MRQGKNQMKQEWKLKMYERLEFIKENMPFFSKTPVVPYNVWFLILS